VVSTNPKVVPNSDNGADITINDPLDQVVSFSKNLLIDLPFNNNTENAANSSHNGAISNGTFSADRMGNAASAIEFAGTGQVSVSSYSAITGMSAFSLSGWIKTSVNGSQMIISKHNNVTDGEWYLATIQDKIRFSRINSSSGRVDCEGDFNYADDEWHHIAGVLTDHP
jgi:hypothetical protein